MTPPTDLSARRGGMPSGTSWKNSASGASGGVGGCMASDSSDADCFGRYGFGATQLVRGSARHPRGQTSIRNVGRPKAGSVPMGGSPLLLRGENGCVVSEANLAFVHGRGVADRLVAGSKGRRVIAETNGASVMGACVRHYLIADADRALSRLCHWLFSRWAAAVPIVLSV